jgi:hypothetical protein
MKSVPGIPNGATYSASAGDEGRFVLGARVTPGHFKQTHEHPELRGCTLVESLHQHGLDGVRGHRDRCHARPVVCQTLQSLSRRLRGWRRNRSTLAGVGVMAFNSAHQARPSRGSLMALSMRPCRVSGAFACSIASVKPLEGDIGLRRVTSTRCHVSLFRWTASTS